MPNELFPPLLINQSWNNFITWSPKWSWIDYLVGELIERISYIRWDYSGFELVVEIISEIIFETIIAFVSEVMFEIIVELISEFILESIFKIFG